MTNTSRSDGMAPAARPLEWFGGTRAGLWTIKHVVSPLDRRLYRWTRGRLLSTGRSVGPIALLTTSGRRTGRQRTTPIFHLRDGERVVICNVRPASERPNPWTLNLRAHPVAQLQIGAEARNYRVREATPPELERYWPELVRVWPAYERFYRQGGRRLVFVLEPITPVEPKGPVNGAHPGRQ